MPEKMVKKYQIFKRSGIGGLEIAHVVDGPYYDESTLIHRWPYRSEEEAERAIENALSVNTWESYYIIPVYEIENVE